MAKTAELTKKVFNLVFSGFIRDTSTRKVELACKEQNLDYTLEETERNMFGSTYTLTVEGKAKSVEYLQTYLNNM